MCACIHPVKAGCWAQLNMGKCSHIINLTAKQVCCTAARPMGVLMLNGNVIIFISTTAHNNVKYINEALVILSTVKRAMNVSCVFSQDR